jgi:hypothetical protein
MIRRRIEFIIKLSKRFIHIYIGHKNNILGVTFFARIHTGCSGVIVYKCILQNR